MKILVEGLRLGKCPHDKAVEEAAKEVLSQLKKMKKRPGPVGQRNKKAAGL